MKYADIVVDNNTDATDQPYTYSYDEDAPFVHLVSIGRKVSISFGQSNRKTDGYILGLKDERPENIKVIKKIQDADENICLTEEAVRTASWMRTRYICRYIEAIHCFLPVSENKRKIKDPFEGMELNEEDAIPKELTDEQSVALAKIERALNQNKYKTFLLKGVTGSGKTEVYLQAMDRCIKSGRQGIVLVPEISLTPQLVARFMARFGRDRVAVLHSKLTPAQRSAEYKKIENKEVDLVIGARSAVFAPFTNIGLIVMDEEHESSYKSDKSPKYDTLEVATKRAMDHGSVVLLGSATPSVTDYFRCKIGLFELIELKKRYNEVSMPKVSIVDMSKEVRKGNRSPFSLELAEGISHALEEKKQVILFLNRRGYSSYISCRECGFVVKCNECGISMPYHKESGKCECHYCGRKVKKPSVCPSCGSELIGGQGLGTEQVEEKIGELFPKAAVDRLDLDSIKKKGALESCLKKFEKGKTDILVGTQIVAKGLDFSNVALVGVINADTTLNLPDFRAAERCFQLVTQAAGRAGRGDDTGKVVIQTYNPESEVLESASKHDYESFFNNEIKIRKAADYPPYSDLYQIMIMDEDKDLAFSYSQKCAEELRGKFGEEISVLGPVAPIILKENSMYRYRILIKGNTKHRIDIYDKLIELKETHSSLKEGAKVLVVDINPYSFT